MGNIPLWLCIPFAGLLLCIAIFPLVKGEWWDKNKGWAVLIWSLLFIIPFAVKYGAGETAETVLECIVNDYLSFIVLLFGLFCVSGNINLEGDFVGSPRMNTGLLAIGTLLSSCIGTTGASMLLVRPMIQMNSWRRNKSHIMVFFIFLISNMGGCLTPIGDPPLLMGFMRGVPFTWSLRLFPVLVFNMVILLTVFYFIDRRAYRRDIALGMRPDISRPTTTFKVNGLHNIIFMVMIVAGVVLSGVLPGMKAFQNADGSVTRSRTVNGCVYYDLDNKDSYADSDGDVGIILNNVYEKTDGTYYITSGSSMGCAATDQTAENGSGAMDVKE